jgi:murein DD-endopeptidase MepM/ murein hydrolase activator NlpD
VRVRIARTGDSLAAVEEAIPLERNTEMRSVVINSSLLGATDAAGIPEQVALKVAEIFAGDLDMRRELRKGARLRVVYETLREAGSFDSPVAGRVTAVELQNGGKRLEAIWFDHDGRGQYFTSDGRGVRKAILRNPLEFTRVTSGFTDSRYHPIFHESRAHKGVDFAAPLGTRVRATGDGIVEFVGQQRGYGNMVVLRHRGNQYTTVYAHLMRFGDGIRRGGAVSQGDVIGMVGMTGYATGPHLHYELRVDNTQVDPMKIAVTETTRVDGHDRARFAGIVAAAQGRFAQADTMTVARFE